MLGFIDSAKVTSNLWGERWSKLTHNAMGNGLSACSGMSGKAMFESETSRRVSIRLGGEAVKIGQALGYELEKIRGMSPATLAAASEGDPAALEAAETRCCQFAAHDREGRPSTGQDMLKGRRTEIDLSTV